MAHESGESQRIAEASSLAQPWYVLGVQQQEAGNLQAAENALAHANQCDPYLTDARVRRAQIYWQWKKYENARELLDLALAHAPGDVSAQSLLVQVLLDLQAYGEARRLLDLLLETQPGHLGALRLSVWLAHAQGDAAEATAAVHRLLACVPNDTAAQVQAAFVLLHAGQIDEAQMWAELAVTQAPERADSWRALSQVRLGQRRLDEALSAVQQALDLSPTQTDSLRQLGQVLLAIGQYGPAQRVFQHALGYSPDDPDIRLELAAAQLRTGHFPEALEGLDALLTQRPYGYPALLVRARVMTEAGQDGAAQACAQLLRSNRFAPSGAKALWRLVGLGDAQARRLLTLVPADVLRNSWRESIVDTVYAHGHSNLKRLVRFAAQELDESPWLAMAVLYVASLASCSDRTSLAKLARDGYRSLRLRNGSAGLPVGPRLVAADPRPRIAYIASHLHQSLLVRVLAAHVADHAHVVFYTNQPLAGLPAHIQQQNWSPDTLAASCATNGIDVLIDTVGLHPIEGQFALLQAYARRIAPVQVGWLGCVCTAGGLFDALLADEVSVPLTHEGLYEETILRLAGGQWCWEPPLSAPEVAAAPLHMRGAPTLGVTSRGLKLSAACLDAFARIVAAMPHATIRFIGEIAVDWPLRREVVACMQAQGVGADRVFFDAFVPHADYLHWFAGIDLVVDSFPGNGGLSLLDPLWMGVPVVTLAGDWAGARQGASLLRTLGLGAWVADTEDAFCAQALALALDADALTRHRQTLRARILGSPLVEGRRLAAQIENFCTRLKARCAAATLVPCTQSHAQWTLDAWLEGQHTIALPDRQADQDIVLTVIVVLCQQAGLSRLTLQALADQHGVCFDTVVVDDASTDRTADLLTCLHGAQLIRNTETRGFLHAARQGAEVARGQYLVFLGSQVILQKGALEAALASLQADARIGALGARAVRVDGTLVDAGHTVFRDGSVGAIGHGEDAFGHAALAARATDAVSGAFFATPASVWHALGGFDEAFAPLDGASADYCLRAWQAGFRVMYEPTIILEHLEGSGATPSDAVPQSEPCRVLFGERHASFLERQLLPQALPLDGDRWRSPEDLPRLPRVLFIDDDVPHMFKGGGLPRARLMLQALRGWPVTLFPLWGLQEHWHAIYASLPNSVEVALGYGLEGLETFLARRHGVYDVVLVSRPPNLQALGPLRARRPDLFAGMRLVYDAEALFALREIAKAGVQRTPMARAAQRARVDAEVALAESASAVLVVSGRDARHFEAAGHRTHILSHGVPVRRAAPGPAGRSGLLFVGALHPDTPNEDGLLWFVREVLPLLRQRMAVPPVLSVVGVCLSDRVAALAGDDVRILGPQQELEPHYDAARVFVAPVRFAGGVPAKVIEAAAAGIPTVASALLVRQLAWRDGQDVVGARDARAFAAAIQALLQDDAAWLRQQRAAWEQCTLSYDPDRFGETLRRVLAGVGA